MRLPVKSDWNGIYLMATCDGFCGRIESEKTMAGIIRNYATMTHDGGQAGVMAAQRYPEDYDGVLARGPTINYTKVNLINCMDNAKDILDENNKPNIDIAYADVIKDAVMEACDDIDGLKDGLITDPRKCNFNPETLLCGKISGEQCLTETQVNALKGLYAPSVDSKNKELYDGLPYGSEEEWKGWVFPRPNAMPLQNT